VAKVSAATRKGRAGSGRARPVKGTNHQPSGAAHRLRPLLQLDDQGAPRRVPPELFGEARREGVTGTHLYDFVGANRRNLELLDVKPEVTPGPANLSVHLRPGGSVGAVPLYAAGTRRIAAGLVVKPRFGWSGIGPLLHRIGWSATPSILSLPLVPGSAREVPPWVLGGPIIARLRRLLQEITRGFRMHEEVRQQPRGQIIWHKYVTSQAARGHFELLPCRFPELGPDLVLRGYIRWGLERVLASLLPIAAGDPIARHLAGEAEQLLFEVRKAEARFPGPEQLAALMRVAGLPSAFLSAGLQALQWLSDERGLAGPAEADGLAWALPMHELFERWVETAVRDWARGFGAIVRAGRTLETSIPLPWTRRAAAGLTSLQPDLLVRTPEGLVIIFDAKYKSHFMELDEQGWAEQGEKLRDEHRHDLHQVLAYAAVFAAERVTAVLVYPVRLGAWERLRDAGRTINVAPVTAGGRQLSVALAALPVEVAPGWEGVPPEWGRLR